MRTEALEYLNDLLVEEHGKKLLENELFIDSGVDSFGTTVVIMEMDAKYGCFDNEWFTEVLGSIETLKVSDILDRIEYGTN